MIASWRTVGALVWATLLLLAVFFAAYSASLIWHPGLASTAPHPEKLLRILPSPFDDSAREEQPTRLLRIHR